MEGREALGPRACPFAGLSGTREPPQPPGHGCAPGRRASPCSPAQLRLSPPSLRGAGLCSLLPGGLGLPPALPAAPGSAVHFEWAISKPAALRGMGELLRSLHFLNIEVK